MPGTISIFAIVAACGSPAFASNSLRALQADTAEGLLTTEAVTIGHIYINASNGERIITRYDLGGQDSPHIRPQPGSRGTHTSGPVWMAESNDPCGDGKVWFATIDHPDRDPAGPIDVGAVFLDWGDGEPDTVVDAVGTTYAASHHDPAGQGVPGLGLSFSWLDADPGYNYCGSPFVAGVTVSDLPGNTGMFPIESWDITIDLVGDPANPMSFELGDTDDNPQGAAFYNAFSYFIYTNDNPLHPFAFRFEFHQPGTYDFNQDGQLDGDPTNLARTRVAMAAPRGTAAPDPDSPEDDIIIDVAPLPSAQGLDDNFGVYFPGGDLYYGNLWYGGFSCDPPRPFSSFVHFLYGPSGSVANCPADITGDGVLNFNDTIAYLGLFNTQDSAADLTGDGLINFNDFIAFLNAFNAGCP